MSSLSIGLTGLNVSQQLLNLAGQNIDNANTPGYQNQVANLAEIDTGSGVGSGVQITSITQNPDQILQQAVNSNASASNSAQTQLNGLNQLQSFLATGSGTLHDSLVSLFSDMNTLSSEPSSLSQRSVVLNDASQVASQLNATVSQIDQMSGNLLQQAQSYTQQVNSLTSQIAQLNQQIQTGTAAGQDVNSMLDSRDQDISSLSQLVGIQTVQQSGATSVFAGGTALVLGFDATSISASLNNQDNIAVTTGGSNQTVNVSGGNLGGVVSLYNSTLPAVQTQLGNFTQALTTQFNQIQATGVGLDGPMTSVEGTQGVDNVSAPLTSAGLPTAPQAGDLYISVTDQATGQTVMNKVAIDPATESLSDVANAISGIPNLNAVVNPQNGTLSIFAAPGYAFDFSGNVSTSPDSQSITGTTVPTLSGNYTGTGNDTLTFTFSGAGTIGTTSNLVLNVTNSAGTQIASLNVGEGYTAGTNLNVDGVNVQLSAGTVNAGDSFSENVTSNPDSSMLLPALGLNTFFVGSSDANLQVNPNLLNNPQQLALSASGQPGDSSNLTNFINLQSQPVLGNGTQSLLQYLEGIIGNVGTQASNMQASSTAYSSLGQQLGDQLQNATGVDTNTALMELVQYQHAYQMSAEWVSSVNQSLSDFLQLMTPVQ
jgi:flagellar hook-associated protein 1 FlgK